MGVLNGASVAIDGSKFKAVNNRDRNFTTCKVKIRISHLEDSASRYLEEMARTDRREQSGVQIMKIERLKDKLSRVRQEVQLLEGIAKGLKDRRAIIYNEALYHYIEKFDHQCSHNADVIVIGSTAI
jgi:hypothetical protein